MMSQGQLATDARRRGRDKRELQRLEPSPPVLEQAAVPGLVDVVAVNRRSSARLLNGGMLTCTAVPRPDGSERLLKTPSTTAACERQTRCRHLPTAAYLAK